MKILYLITKSNWGGAQTYVYDLATSLGDRVTKSSEFEMVVAVGGNGPLIEKLKGLSHKALAANEDNITNVAVEIAKFLQDWLTGHVIENDLPLKPYMERIREETQDMPKLAMEANVTSDSSEAPAGTTVH